MITNNSCEFGKISLPINDLTKSKITKLHSKVDYIESEISYSVLELPEKEKAEESLLEPVREKRASGRERGV